MLWVALGRSISQQLGTGLHERGLDLGLSLCTSRPSVGDGGELLVVLPSDCSLAPRITKEKKKDSLSNNQPHTREI